MQGKVGVVLPAGGKGLRLGGELPKQFLDLGGRPMFRFSLEQFHRMEPVGEIALVLPEAFLEKFADIPLAWPKVKLVPGGTERWESVRNGVCALDNSLDMVLIHDVARPFLTSEVVDRCLVVLDQGMSVITALQATDTVKEVDGTRVSRTVDRSKLVMVQTPQGFPRVLLESVYAAYPEGFGALATDEAQIVEMDGYPVAWVEGHPLSRKVTGEDDWQWALWTEARIRSGEIRLG